MQRCRVYRPTVLTLLGLGDDDRGDRRDDRLHHRPRAHALPQFLAVHFDQEGIADRWRARVLSRWC